MANLTIKQENFCNFYIETGNASEAYRRAYSCENMKDETVNRNAICLLNNNKITTRVKELQNQMQRKSDITKEEALIELANIARSRVTDIMNVKGTRVVVKSLSDLPDNVISSIASVKKVKGSIEVRFYDKIAAIDRLAKMLGWDKPTEMNVKSSVSLAPLSKEDAKKMIEDLENGL